MHLIDDHVAKVSKKPPNRRVLVEQEGLERLGRDLQDAARVLEQLRLVRSGNIAMPVPDGDIGLFAEVVQAVELVVDKSFERADVERPDRCGRVLPKLGEYGEEGGFGLARGGRGGEQHVLICVEDGICCGDLDRPEVLPAMRVDEVLYKRRVSIECVQAASRTRW